MTFVVGCAPDETATPALDLAAMLARSAGEDLVAAVVVPEPWVPGMARVDAEYQQFLGEQADAALEAARHGLPEDVPARFVPHRARSVPAGLMELVEEYDAQVLVCGSSAAGALGHVAFGSVTDHLLHSSARVLALAPRGYRSGAARVSRVTASYGGAEPTEDLVLGAAGVAARVGASLRLASFAVRPVATISAGIGSRAETAVVEQWSRRIEEQARDTMAKVDDLPQPPLVEPSTIGRGTTWAAALDDVEWTDGDVLVVGSSRYGPVAQVFLGSRAAKIVRHSPVPVVVVPRGRQVVLAEEAQRAGATG